MNQVIVIGAGGALGSILRYWLSSAVQSVAGRAFPYGTLVVNVIGCFAMGFLFVLFLERFAENSLLRTGLLIGVLGGFTTFSAFSMETFTLLNEGESLKALANIFLSVAFCVAATWIGFVLAKQL